MENSCIFCKIINKDIPANIVYEDENFLAFLDIQPVNIGHTLVIPKEHSINILDAREEVMSAMMLVVKKISTAIKNGLNADGINVHMNNEKASGQLVFHTHMHIIPRFEGDGFIHWKGKRSYNEKEEEKIINKIIENLN